jgi:hypothetical protein
VIAVFLNCCINPFIYAFQFDQFKKELFKRCRKTPDPSDMSVMSHASVIGRDVGRGSPTSAPNLDISKSHNGSNGEFDNICYEED